MAAGAIGAVVSARAKAGRFSGKTFWKETGKGLAWAAADAGIGKAVTRMYWRPGHAKFTRLRHGRKLEFNKETKRVTYRKQLLPRVKVTNPKVYMHQALVGFPTSVYANGLHRRRR